MQRNDKESAPGGRDRRGASSSSNDGAYQGTADYSSDGSRGKAPSDGPKQSDMDYRAGAPFDDDYLTRRGYERTLYDYELPDGTLVNQKCRYEVPEHKGRPGVDAPKKKFLVRRPADDRYDRTYDIGRCIFGAGKRRVIYGWRAIMKAGPGTTVFVPEGEKNADDLIKAGYLATTTLDGEWPPECAAPLTGYHLIILADH